MKSDPANTRQRLSSPAGAREPVLLEFGGHYYKEGRFDFKVRLHFHALAHLADDARSALRLYELLMIRRPGDIWNYLWVEVVEVPGQVLDQVARSREESGINSMRAPWPEKFIPFVDFDKMFRWCWDDTEREDACWLEAREGPLFRELADGEFAKIRDLQLELGKNCDVLIAHEISEIAAVRHPKDYIVEHRITRTLPGYQSPARRSLRTRPYYGKLKSLLDSPEVKSVAAAGDSDFETNRLIFSEQRRRADAQGCAPGKALLVCMSSDGVAYADEWGAAAHYYEVEDRNGWDALPCVLFMMLNTH